jgi:putative tryptophan/tyrosine transport system substrate-binding protein
MRRREFVTLIGGATAAWPFAARAQQSKVRRIGCLLLGNADAESFRTELRDGLRKLGYVEGQNIIFDFRSAEGNIDLLPKLAAELVALRLDVIVALYTPCALAAQQATREIPIVVVSGDPVGTGLVTSLNRPGGNITGLSLMAAELHGKCVELFRDMLPFVRRVAVLLNAEDPFWKQIQEQVRRAGRNAGIEIAPSVMVRGSNEIDAAFAAMKKQGAGAVVVHGSSSTRRRTRAQARPASGDSNAVICRSRRPDVVWRRWPRRLSEDSALRDQDLAGRQPCKYAGGAADEIRINCQPHNRQSSRDSGSRIFLSARR